MLSLTQSTRLSPMLKIPLMMMLRTQSLTLNLMKYAFYIDGNNLLSLNEHAHFKYTKVEGIKAWQTVHTTF